MSYNAATLSRRLTGEKYTRHEGDDETSSLSSSSSSALQGKILAGPKKIRHVLTVRESHDGAPNKNITADLGEDD